jgi:hypothetical protein
LLKSVLRARHGLPRCLRLLCLLLLLELQLLAQVAGQAALLHRPLTSFPSRLARNCVRSLCSSEQIHEL